MSRTKQKQDLTNVSTRDHTDNPIILCNDTIYIGNEKDLIAWAYKKYRYTPERTDFGTQARAAYVRALEKSKSKFCYFDVESADIKGRVVFELFRDRCPDTCKNFESLCTGEIGDRTYAGSTFHRVVPGGWIQGGDIVSGSGLDGICASGDGDFADENFTVKHDAPGILSMAGSARHSNNSQFFVTLQALPWLDEQRVAFGRVISGMRVLRQIEVCETKNQRPMSDVVVKDCGVLLLDGDAAPKSSVEIESRTLETQTSLLMYVFREADDLGLGRARVSDLVRVIEESNSVQRDFAKYRDNFRDAVQAFGDVLADSVPSRSHVSLAEFLDLTCAILQDANVEEMSHDSTFYRAMKRIPVVVELDTKDSPSTPRMFGNLQENEMKYVESLFRELLASSGSDECSKQTDEIDSKQEDNGNGLLDIKSLLDALPETMPVDLATYLDDAETKTRINLEELYGYFDACKREKGGIIEEIIAAGTVSSSSNDVDEKKNSEDVSKTEEEVDVNEITVASTK